MYTILFIGRHFAFPFLFADSRTAAAAKLCPRLVLRAALPAKYFNRRSELRTAILAEIHALGVYRTAIRAGTSLVGLPLRRFSRFCFVLRYTELCFCGFYIALY